MKHHVIKLEELRQWLIEEEATFASSTRERKKLTSTLSGGLKVYVGSKVVWEGIHPYDAINEYNSITDKYIDPIKDFKI